MCVLDKIYVEELVCASTINTGKYAKLINPTLIGIGVSEKYVIVANKKVDDDISLYVALFESGTYWYFGYTNLTGILLIDSSKNVKRMVSQYNSNSGVGWIVEQFEHRLAMQRSEQEENYWWWVD